MKLRIDFDNESEGEVVTLDALDLTIDVGETRLEPVEITDGHVALYDAPDDLDMSDLDAALEDFQWSFNGYSIVDDCPAPEGP
ncbi:hypothetical protein [Paracoccus sp. ME4]|uniref:hypothetical protein n=1 Tax=Paracoccus sp. ME4 TaxID=3138066 RepID=UPI00398B7720